MEIPLLADWLPEATGMLELKPSTRRSYGSLTRILVEPWGHLRLDELSPLDVQRWVSASPHSASRTRQAHAVLRGSYKMAVQYGLVESSPCVTTRLPRLPRTERRALTREEVNALADACEGYGAFVRFLALTGLRWSEAVELRGRDVDGARVKVSRARVQEVVGTPKNHQARVVFLPAGFEVPPAGDDELVWKSPKGLGLRHSNFMRGPWRRAVDSSGVAATPHELRHTACSWMLDAGVPVHVVMRVMGHSSPTLTLKVYSHVREVSLQDAAAALGNKMTTA